MNNKRCILQRQDGFVLVLCMFMLALVSMIGIAAMLTSHTAVDVARNEKFEKLSFYQSETGLTIGAEIVELEGGYDSIGDNTAYDDNATIEVIDGDFLFEAKDNDNSTGEWNKYKQADCICFQDADGNCVDPNIDCDDNTPDIQITGFLLKDLGIISVNDDVAEDLRVVDIDVDKTGVRHLAGGGAEFGAGAEGIGVATHRVIYIINSIGYLPSGRTVSADHVLGFQLIPRF